MRRWLGRMAALMRAGVVVALIAFGLLAFGLRAARADAARAAMALGRQVLPLLALETDKTSLRINGQDLFVSSAIVDGSVEDVLDRFEAQCAAAGSPLAEAWRKVAHDRKTEAAVSRLPRLDVVRRSERGEGVVFCFVGGSTAGVTFEAALARFSKERDLGALGQLRYAFAKPSDDGRVRVMATWTEGTFKLDAQTAGEAAGSDPSAAPRPPSSRRLLSASLVGAPYGIYAYGTDASPEAVLRFYDRAMNEAKWVAVTPPEPARGRAAERIYVKDDLHVLVSAGPDGKSPGGPRDSHPTTLVSIGELGAQGAQK